MADQHARDGEGRGGAMPDHTLSPAMRRTLAYLCRAGAVTFGAVRLAKVSGQPGATLRALVARGLLQKREYRPTDDANPWPRHDLYTATDAGWRVAFPEHYPDA